MRRPSAQSGIVLLEVLVALAILGIIATAATTLSAAAGDAVRRARAADQDIEGASALLDAVALWPREDFDRRLGARRQGPFWMYVLRVYPTLYEVELRDSTRTKLLLQTAVFRPLPQAGIDNASQ